jgi:aminoglycoside phosphotransferase (APT) family kinase protein
MTAARPMHPDLVRTDVALVHRLVARQFPQWAELPITSMSSWGTDHDIYRLGERLALRFPRVAWASGQPAKEARWLPLLAPYLPLAVPTPVALGEPGEGYPFSWAVHEWLPGQDAGGRLLDLDRAATELARFVAALRAVETTGGPPRAAGARGGPLSERDEAVRRSVAALGDRIDGAAALRSWELSLAAPVWQSGEVWVHGDLLPGNLLVVDDRLTAVIDFGGLAIGDPACDLLPAWHLFAGTSRSRFLAGVDADDASRFRGRGWALSQALIALPYYWDTNPGIVRQSQHALAQVLAEDEG